MFGGIHKKLIMKQSKIHLKRKIDKGGKIGNYTNKELKAAINRINTKDEEIMYNIICSFDQLKKEFGVPHQILAVGLDDYEIVIPNDEVGGAIISKISEDFYNRKIQEIVSIGNAKIMLTYRDDTPRAVAMISIILNACERMDNAEGIGKLRFKSTNCEYYFRVVDSYNYFIKLIS